MCFAAGDLFVDACEEDFLQGFLKNKDRKLAHTFNSSFRYIDDGLSVNNSPFGDYLHRFHPNIKDTTDTQKSASYLDIHHEFDNRGRLKTKLYDKRDDFTFPIVNFPVISSNIAASQVCGVYISQLIHYSRACVQFSNFLERAPQKLLKQGYVAPRLKSGWSLRNIHISNDNGSFTFYVDVVFPLSVTIIAKTFTGLDCIYV